MRTLLSAAFLLVLTAAAFADGVPADTQSLSAEAAAKRNEEARAELDRARQAVAREDWPEALRDWNDLFVHGNAEAPVQLCRMYFDGRQGEFSARQTVQWCRLAVADNDAGGLYRMGLLYLVGLGVDRNFDQARAICAAARTLEPGPDVAAGFCLAVVAQEKSAVARESMREPPVPSSGIPETDVHARAPAQECAETFASNGARFDSALAVKWCGEAASAGDPGAIYRLGLMKLMGLGMKRDLAAATSDCESAQARSGGRLSAAYCVAAAAALRNAARSAALGRELGDIDTNPAIGGALPKTEADPYLADRLLDEPHQAPTGLQYTCRDMQEWALFEAPDLTILNPRDKLFGRKIIEYQPSDFAALDQGAAECISALSRVDADGKLRHDLATFQSSLTALRARRSALLAEQSKSGTVERRVADVNRLGKADVLIVPSFLTAHENACVDHIRRVWLASTAATKKHQALEISDTALATEKGNYVVRGHARAIETDDESRDVKAYDRYSCTFVGQSGKIASSSLDAYEPAPAQSADEVQ